MDKQKAACWLSKMLLRHYASRYIYTDVVYIVGMRGMPRSFVYGVVKAGIIPAVFLAMLLALALFSTIALSASDYSETKVVIGNCTNVLRKEFGIDYEYVVKVHVHNYTVYVTFLEGDNISERGTIHYFANVFEALYRQCGDLVEMRFHRDLVPLDLRGVIEYTFICQERGTLVMIINDPSKVEKAEIFIKAVLPLTSRNADKIAICATQGSASEAFWTVIERDRKTGLLTRLNEMLREKYRELNLSIIGWVGADPFLGAVVVPVMTSEHVYNRVASLDRNLAKEIAEAMAEALAETEFPTRIVEVEIWPPTSFELVPQETPLISLPLVKLREDNGTANQATLNQSNTASTESMNETKTTTSTSSIYNSFTHRSEQISNETKSVREASTIHPYSRVPEKNAEPNASATTSSGSKGVGIVLPVLVPVLLAIAVFAVLLARRWQGD
jgi:uncharacterized membrane protein